MNHLREHRNPLCLAVALLWVSLLAVAQPAVALPYLVIDFETGGAGPGGTVVVGGGGVVGSDILLNTLTSTYEFATPVSTVYDLSGAGVGANNISTAILNFSAGGSASNYIEIIGGVPALGIADGTVLLTGFFTDYYVSDGGAFGVVSGTGRDFKSNVLLTALGLPNDLNFDFFGFTIGISNGQAGTYVVHSTDVVNKVPGPSVLVGLGAGLLALAAVARRLKM